MSDLLNSASLVMIPSGYKEDVVYSQIPTSGAGDLTFTRASNGTRVNSAGLVEVCPWNLLEQSETIGVSPWAIQNCSVTANTTTAPNGTTTAETLAEDSNTSRKFLYQDRTIVANQEYTLTIYVKANTLQYIRLIANDLSENFRWFGAQFNLTALTYTSATGSNGNATFTSASITDAGNGWYRISVSGTINTTSLLFGIFPSNGATLSSSDDRGGNTYLGTGKTAYIWGAQLNIGSTAKPYFPTTDRLNVPRLTYQNGGGGCPSLLLEKQSTNLALYSEQFDNAAWSKNTLTIGANATISPDGTQNADNLIPTTSNGFHYALQNISFSSGATTMSCYAKSGGYDWLVLDIGVSNGFAYFNVTSGVVGTTGSGATASIQSVGNGWYRCIVTFTLVSSGSYILVSVRDADNGGQFVGNGTSGVYLWGCQLEASSYPTSYIPTTSSSATRVADKCFKTGISSLIGQTEGALYFEGTVEGVSASTRRIFSLSDGTNANYLVVYNPGGTRGLDFVTAIGGVVQCNIVSSTNLIQFGQRFKMAIAYAQNDFAFYVNGGQIGIDGNGNVPSPIDKFVFGRGDEAALFEGTNSQVALFPTRLTNAELASLTTI